MPAATPAPAVDCGACLRAAEPFVWLDAPGLDSPLLLTVEEAVQLGGALMMAGLDAVEAVRLRPAGAGAVADE